MLYRLLADAIVLVHFAFIVFVAVGGLMAWRWPRLLWLHVPAVAWGLGIVTVGYVCPLTPLEKHFRRRGDAEAYEGGFVDRYIEDVVYPDEYTETRAGGLRTRAGRGERPLSRRSRACAAGSSAPTRRSGRSGHRPPAP